ncbi:SDR family NAD(P)-dependent oxidoreductase [Umezakia ovalisporum]|jgi:NAD(P)-dependent dehydrogenase (short-subunit alcohol dehydrogenase family)|uniref:SDR family NAD(P)-dependent oxidoreductase n=2 Tax=Umezakia ovalisporum TaxID=75695 RepID=A0AA43KFQ8_9CYAN|nr:SDR family NAD(P)-dependent oxidoreductase [Umezakia ovalisporum]MBI1242016.1 SDR family NAD(P)-dependent oxidoreductase [Nostoc sp. RI_552]MDH6056623.1 SDR family NAD(P)-dependent oxidoreductase [Umezakia ovalisporum FSS-43]MDH6065099.1 SDR family NAD(P)-dependent oxidoreductase [Umezakia ovalisporum FSS-62]MDH6067288.1 SDR family NAD(P)-dependent oxidoreductase [Umezakia ovalisporum APH033B]MDH6070194.1 SDR family NAD(P)-dependent oxidoreductase [Umezakia ovalisporum CobakiLakeA]
MHNLEGKVTLVTGATRGIGKGIAIALGEAGATVYVTGRTLDKTDASNQISGTLNDTKAAVEEAGGICIPVQVDHSDDEQVRWLFQRIENEQNGQLDLLVNNVFSGVPGLRENQGKRFWECEPSFWDANNNVGLRSHYVASVFAAQMMVKRQQGLICTISSWGGMSPIFSVAYGVGKAACDRLAADMAKELKANNIASVSMWPGIVGTEQISQLADDMAGQNVTDQGNSVITERYNWETPLFTGRVIAALTADAHVMLRTGKVQIVAELAQQYGIVDEQGDCPGSLRSLKFIIPAALPALRKYSSLIPDIKIPWSLLLLTILKSPQI